MIAIPVLLKGLLVNKYTIGLLLLVAAFGGGYFKGRASALNQQTKKELKEVIKYVERKNTIDRKYNNVVVDRDDDVDSCVLQGCLPEGSKTNLSNNEVCKDCYNKD